MRLVAMQHRQAVLTEGTPRLDLVVQAWTGQSRAVVRGMFSHGCVTLNQRPCAEAGLAVAAGALLSLHYDDQRKYKEKPIERGHRDFQVVFEDAYLIVVNKAAGVLTVPTDRCEDNTLVHQVAQHLSRGARITRRAHIVHRLDRDTSGLLVFARSEDVAHAIKAQFEARKPTRRYVAIVAGVLPENSGTYRSYLTTNADLDQYSTTDPSQGKLAITHFNVVRRFRDATWVEVQLETGRRNQIRVHFAEHHHPVLGDVRYQSERARHPHWPHPRLALHAQTLGFTHPVTGAPLSFTSVLPAMFGRFADSMR